MSIEVLRLAVETGMYPLYEYENGQITSVKKIKDRKPVKEYLEKQKRYAHLFKMPGGDKEIEKIQHIADLNAEAFRPGRRGESRRKRRSERANERGVTACTLAGS